MRPQTTRRGHTDMRRYDGITWRGVGVAYGLLMLVFAVIWVASYPVVAPTVLALIAGTLVVIRVGMLIIRRQTRRTIYVPGTDVSLTI